MKKLHSMYTKDDLVEWVRKQLPNPFQFHEKTGALYQQDIRKFEYCSRPLWVIFSLMASQEDYSNITDIFIQRIKCGLRPHTSLTFPFPTTKTRQIAVEMAVYGYGLLSLIHI